MKLSKYLPSKFFPVIVIMALGLFLPFGAMASPVFNWIAEAIFRVILSPIFLLLNVEITLLVPVARYNNFINEDGVIAGWTAVRDVCNMFFILMLLIISFATIIRVQGYGYRQLLSRLIIIAILINFSRTIVGVLIDFSQIIMLTFVASFQDIVAGNLIVALGVDKVLSLGTSQIDLLLLPAMIMAAIFMIVATVVIGVILVMLFVRIVRLWILTIMAPLAFVAYIFPRTQGFFKKWSGDLGRNLVAGPVLAFFLWLTFAITGQYQFTSFDIEGNRIEQSQQELQATTGTQLGTIVGVNSFANESSIIKYMITIALLVGALQLAAASGAAGASFAGQMAGQVSSRLSRAGRRLTLSPASRMGAAISRSMVDEEGEFRRGLKPLSYMPFMGKQVQQAAMKMQGYDAMRQRKELEEDTRYVLPSQRQAYLKTETTMDADKGGVRAALGKAYSVVSSRGENLDKDRQLSLIKHERGDYTAKDVPQMAQHARELGNEKMLLDLQGKYVSAYKDEGEMKRRLQLVGGKGMLSGLEDKDLLDENKNPTKKAQQLMQVLMEDEKTDGRDISETIRRMPKDQRQGLSKAVLQVYEKGDLDKHKGNQMFDADENGNVLQDEQGRLALKNKNAAVKAMLTIGQVYPNKVGGLMRDMVASIDYSALKFDPKDIVDHLDQRPGEKQEKFKERKSKATNLLDEIKHLDEGQKLVELANQNGGVLPKEQRPGETPETAKARYAQEDALLQEAKSKNYLEERSQKMSALVKEAHILPESSYEYDSVDDWIKDGHKVGWDNINIGELKPAKDEGEEAFAARIIKSAQHNAQAAQRHQEQVEEMKKRLAEVEAEQKPKDIDQLTWQRQQRDKKAVVLEDPGRDNAIKVTLFKELFDGMDASRIAELDMSNPEHKEIARLFAHYSTTTQQVAAFNSNTRTQNEEFIRILAESGRKIPKTILDNSSPQLNAEAQAINLRVSNQYFGMKSPESVVGKIDESFKKIYLSNTLLRDQLSSINPTLVSEIERVLAEDKEKEKKNKEKKS
ncbi:MAG: hypothetical protein PHO91_04465 [Patescibacteria group bacterium]|nr:hypothetical protein [Patescibacteria group bacterium]